MSLNVTTGTSVWKTPKILCKYFPQKAQNLLNHFSSDFPKSKSKGSDICKRKLAL